MTMRTAVRAPSADATARLAALDAATRALTEIPDTTAATAAQADQLPVGADLDDPVSRARDVLRRAAERRGLSAAHTVVALAGATGGGKSSLFNALLGEHRAAVGVRRPTTSSPTAAVLADGDPDEAGPLLDWLEIGQRHLVGSGDGDGLVLVDLPDIDSVQVDHQQTVDRLARVVDVLVWVVDPQKYADNLLHQRYLRPMATHAAVTVVVLNQADTLDPDERSAVLGDLRRLLAADGLAEVPVLLTSARTGEGVETLRERLADVARRRFAQEARLGADARAAGIALLEHVGSPEPAGIGRRDRHDLAVVLADAAGVEIVAGAVGRSYRMRARSATGWPPTRWLARLRPDPLRRLGLDREAVDPALVRSARPQPTAVQRSRVDGAVRALGQAASTGAVEPWRTSIRSTAVGAARDLGDALDQAVVSTRLDTARTPRWWWLAGALQWLFLATAVAGVLWLGVIALLGYLQLPEPEVARLGAVPWPTVLAAGGALGGILLALLCRVAAGVGASRRAHKVRHRLRESVARVADDVVIAPVSAEVDRCVRVTAAAKRAAQD